MNRIPQHSATVRNGLRNASATVSATIAATVRNGPQHTPIYYVYKPAAF